MTLFGCIHRQAHQPPDANFGLDALTEAQSSALADPLNSTSDKLEALNHLSRNLAQRGRLSHHTHSTDALRRIIGVTVEAPALQNRELPRPGEIMCSALGSIASEIVPIAPEVYEFGKNWHDKGYPVFGAKRGALAATTTRKLRNLLMYEDDPTGSLSDRIAEARKRIGLQSLAATMEIGNRTPGTASGNAALVGAGIKSGAKNAAWVIGTLLTIQDLGAKVGLGIGVAGAIGATAGVAAGGILVGGLLAAGARAWATRGDRTPATNAGTDPMTAMTDGEEARRTVLRLDGSQFGQLQHEPGSGSNWGIKARKTLKNLEGDLPGTTRFTVRDGVAALQWVAENRSIQYKFKNE